MYGILDLPFILVLTCPLFWFYVLFLICNVDHSVFMAYFSFTTYCVYFYGLRFTMVLQCPLLWLYRLFLIYRSHHSVFTAYFGYIVSIILVLRFYYCVFMVYHGLTVSTTIVNNSLRCCVVAVYTVLKDRKEINITSWFVDAKDHLSCIRLCEGIIAKCTYVALNYQEKTCTGSESDIFGNADHKANKKWIVMKLTELH